MLAFEISGLPDKLVEQEKAPPWISGPVVGGASTTIRGSSNKHSAKSLSDPEQPVYLNSVAAGPIIGCDKATVIRRVQADAWHESSKGDQLYSLWLRSTLERYVAERQAAAQ
jgi:hypothetical protein